MNSVRPTKRCLDDLDTGFPPLDVPLERAGHELVEKAQRLPDEHASGGAERIRALTDHHWFKVKVGEYRGAGGRVSHRGTGVPSLWWLVAGGRRRADSAGQDFYGRLESECKRAAKGSRATVSSDHLLPQNVDWRRLELEQAALGVIALKRAVREAIRQSAHSSDPVAATTNGQRLIAWVRSRDGDTYLAISAEGFLDKNEIAIVLDAVPGMNPDDWSVEPGEILGITPDVGQLVYSAIMPPEALATILNNVEDGQR